MGDAGETPPSNGDDGKTGPAMAAPANLDTVSTASSSIRHAISPCSAQEAKQRIDENNPIDWSEYAGGDAGDQAALSTAVTTDVQAPERTTDPLPSPAAVNWDELARNFGLLAAREAPTLSATWLSTNGRQPALILVPIAYTGVEACAMVSLAQEPDALFGATRDERQSGAEQGEILAARLTGGIETQYAAPTAYYGANDAVILVPWASRPTFVARSPAHRTIAREAGLRAAWCTLDALHDHVAYHAVSLAFQRIAAITTVGEHGEQRAGTWEYARPIVSTRTAHEWASRPELPTDVTAQSLATFMEVERARGRELRARLIELDNGNGAMAAMADNVRTAADYEGEIPFPANGLPDFSDGTLRLLPFAERPLSLCTSWLARLPPQSVPPGFSPRSWLEILRPWARRLCSNALNATADRDFECWYKGSSTLRRPPYVCIGLGGGKEIPHADGIGSYNALSIVYELDPATGLYDKLDFQRPGRTHWNLAYLKEAFGIHDDQQLMSLVMHGVRWGVQAPVQIRIAANLERLDARIRGVGEAFKKLIAKGLYYKYAKLRRAHEKISPDGPGPFIIIPSYIVGTGGTDKPDNPNEKRIIGDQGAPHADQSVRERNEPHGAPDGPPVMSLNDMMGPEPGRLPRGSTLDGAKYPMPHPETKVRPRQAYGDSAVLNHMAHVNNTYVAGFKSDGRHMFFQFEMAPEEERTCSFTVIIPFPLTDDSGTPILDENGDAIVEPWFVLIVATSMNMGSRNSSKIAQRFTDRLLEAFSTQLDVYVRDFWLPRQTPGLQALLAERSARLGPRQARPFKTSGYTDDYEFEFIGPDLFAVGARTWIDMCAKANYWLSDKASAGTVIDFIGGRLVLNGGFGCLSPSKHARAVADSTSVCEGAITREALESHNSYLVHVHDWLDFPAGTLKGLSAPLRIPGTPEQRAEITERVRAQHRKIIALLHKRRAASFWSGVNEALHGRPDPRTAIAHVRFNPRFASDACSDVARPFICGVCNGIYFRFALDGDWRRRHITITEACGTVLTLLILSEYFPEGEILIESDATASLATTRATAGADDLIYLRRRAEEEEKFRTATRRSWITHCKGWANGLADAGSRDKMDEMRALADAFGIRLREVPVPPEALAFMRDVLANSTETAEDEGSHATSLGTHNLSMTGDMPIAHPSTASLLAHLNFALVHDADEMEISRRAHKVAWHLGIVKASIACKGITAACLCIMQPVKFRCRHAAAKKRHTSASNCYHWIKLLEDKIREEHAQSTTSGSSPAAPTAQQAQLGLVAAPGHAPPPANGRVMEVAAVFLDGEEGGQTFPRLHYGPLPPDHPQRYFWAGAAEEADWMRKPTTGAGGSNDPQPNLEQPMGQPDAAHLAHGAEQSGRTTDAGTAVQDAEPTEEEMLAEAETIASLILLGRRSPSTQFDPRADQPKAPAPPSLPPSPPEMTSVPTQGQIQAPRSRPATPPLTRQRTGIEASGDALPSASGDVDIDAIVALLDVDASTEAINAAADREMRDAPGVTDHAEAEEMLRAWSAPRSAIQRQPDPTDGPATGTLLWFVIASEGPAALPYRIGKMFSVDASQTRASRRYLISPEPPRAAGQRI